MLHSQETTNFTNNDADSVTRGHKEDFRQTVQFEAAFADARFDDMHFRVQIHLNVDLANAHRNSLTVMSTRSDIYYYIDNPLYSGEAGTPIMDLILKYFMFFIDEIVFVEEYRPREQAQAEWDAYIDWKIKLDIHRPRILALAMATHGRLGTQTPLGLKELVNTRLLIEGPGMFGDVLGGPSPEAGQYGERETERLTL